MLKLNTLRVVRPSPQFCGGPRVLTPASSSAACSRGGSHPCGESDLAVRLDCEQAADAKVLNR
jgi:hypothetical protein